MPISQLDERIRMPRLGVIRLGVKKVSSGGKEYPAEVDHFVLPDELQRRLKDERPKAIDVLLPSDNPRVVLDAWLTKYEGPILVVRCDGSQCRSIDKETGQQTVGPCQMPKWSGKQEACPCGAEPKARLNVIPMKSSLGVYQVLIGGWQRIADLMSELEMYLAVFGRLTNIVFRLERVEAKTQVQTPKGRISRTGWPVHLRTDYVTEDVMARRGLGSGALPALTGLIVESEEEPEDFEHVEEPAENPASAVRGADSGGGHGLGPVQDITRPRIRPESPARPQETDDVSMLIHRAVKLGISEKLYKLYLSGMCRGLESINDLPESTACNQMALLSDAERSEVDRKAFLRAITDAANAVLAGKS